MRCSGVVTPSRRGAAAPMWAEDILLMTGSGHSPRVALPREIPPDLTGCCASSLHLDPFRTAGPHALTAFRRRARIDGNIILGLGRVRRRGSGGRKPLRAGWRRLWRDGTWNRHDGDRRLLRRRTRSRTRRGLRPRAVAGEGHGRKLKEEKGARCEQTGFFRRVCRAIPMGPTSSAGSCRRRYGESNALTQVNCGLGEAKSTALPRTPVWPASDPPILVASFQTMLKLSL
jgi:hypothetical protein